MLEQIAEGLHPTHKHEVGEKYRQTDRQRHRETEKQRETHRERQGAFGNMHL